MRNMLFLAASALPLTLGLAIVYAASSLEHRGETRTAVEIYGKYCASCHGKDGQAKTVKAKFNHARNIADPGWQDEVSDERIFNSITNGRKVRGSMPSFGKKLSQEEIESLVTYVRGLRK